MEGKKFNKLFVLRKGNRSKSNKIKWVCKCDCGNEVEVLGTELKSGGTKSCGCIQGDKNRKSKEEWVSQVIEKRGNFYNYDEGKYINTHTPIKIICPVHGPFFQRPREHLHRGQGCPKCGIINRANKRKKGTKKWVEEAISKRGDFYDYSNVDYKNNHTEVEIICPVHGSFFQKPDIHIRIEGNCPSCRYEKISGCHSHLPEQTLLELKPGFVYLLNMKGKEESFYKVGITKNPNKRLVKGAFSPYTFDIIEIIETLDMLEAVLIEKNVLSLQNKYYPYYHFAGRTECFS